MSNSIKKAKNNFIYMKNGEKYYDLSDNCNIIGHSHRLLTTIPKNSLSVAWSISGDTLYSRRFCKFIKSKFSEKYTPFAVSSFDEFFLLLFNHNIYPNFIGNDTIDYLKNRNILLKDSQNEPDFVDMTQLYLNNEIFQRKSSDNILNYYWYPELDIETNDENVVILPKLYSGFTDTVFILIKNEVVEKYSFLKKITEISSFTLICALHLYYTIKKVESKNRSNFLIKNDDFIQKGRIFSLKDSSNFEKYYDYFAKNHILINNNIPQYGYFPISLETYQIKYLNKFFANKLE